MARYLLVPGACHGGWWYQPVVDALREAGHEADAVTLSGLDPDGPPAPAANLDAHSMTNDEQRDWYSRGSGATGLAVEPLPFFDHRARPHPLGTLMQRSQLTGAYKTIRRKHYVAAAGADWLPHSPFTGIADSLRADPDWTVTDLDSGHNVLANGPDDLVTIILDLAW